MAPTAASKGNSAKKKSLKPDNAAIAKKPSHHINLCQYLTIKCPICFENFKKQAVSSTKCGHVFCTECLRRALRRHRVCPTCRTSLRGSRGHHPLYLDTNIDESTVVTEFPPPTTVTL